MVLGVFLSLTFMPETLGKPMTENFLEFQKIYDVGGDDDEVFEKNENEKSVPLLTENDPRELGKRLKF